MTFIMMFESVFNFILQSSMVIGPVVGYFDQIAQIRRTSSSSGFSLDTCGVLLVSSIIRVSFWFGKRFDNVLLYQSIVMIIVQLILLHECIKFRYPLSPLPNRRWFWNWYTYKSYIFFLAILTVVLGLLFVILGSQSWFVELLGFLALGIESTVPMPQAWQNFQYQSVAGFSPLILFTWFFGDSFKTFYYTHTGAPLQFILCGIAQLTVDSIVVLQFVFYDRKLREMLGLDTSGLTERVRGSPSYNSLDDIM